MLKNLKCFKCGGWPIPGVKYKDDTMLCDNCYNKVIPKLKTKCEKCKTPLLSICHQCVLDAEIHLTPARFKPGDRVLYGNKQGTILAIELWDGDKPVYYVRIKADRKTLSLGQDALEEDKDEVLP